MGKRGPKVGSKQRKTRIREAAQRRALEKAIRVDQLSAERVLEEARRLAFTDLRGFFDETGNLRPVHTLTPEQGAALASVEVIIKNAAAGDGQTDRVHKLKLWDKTRAIEMLMKHFALLTERVELTAESELIQALLEGRKRAASRG